jgi:hypothetical protein
LLSDHCIVCKSYSYVYLLLLMQQAKAHLLEVEPFEHAFGPKGKRKRPKLTALDYESLLKRADDSQGQSYTLTVTTL